MKLQTHDNRHHCRKLQTDDSVVTSTRNCRRTVVITGLETSDARQWSPVQATADVRQCQKLQTHDRVRQYRKFQTHDSVLQCKKLHTHDLVNIIRNRNRTTVGFLCQKFQTYNSGHQQELRRKEGQTQHSSRRRE